MVYETMNLPPDNTTSSLVSQKRNLQQVFEVKDPKSFNWTITSFYAKSMTIQL